MDIRKKNVIVSEFNDKIKSLILKLEKRSRNEQEIADLDRLKKRLSVFKQTMGDEAIIKEAGPFLLKYSSKIVARDEDFFKKFDVKSEMGDKIKKSDEFIYSLIDTIKKYYLNMRQSEKDQTYEEVKVLHDNYLEYILSMTEMK